jgi:hypothetical protein
VRVRIVGVDLPGASCPGYAGIKVGVQRGKEFEQLVSADGAEAVFELEVGQAPRYGPYVHGRGDDRFFYLCWVAGPDEQPFRRAKVMLADVPGDVWAAAASSGSVLEGRLGLTDHKGNPTCARVRPPDITWQAVSS